MRRALAETYDAIAEPRIVIAIGDCARNCGEFVGGSGVFGSVGDVVPVDVEVAGCPPEPEKIVAALRSVTGR
jgi:Ni,Fe-hydrogenase III small subunit